MLGDISQTFHFPSESGAATDDFFGISVARLQIFPGGNKNILKIFRVPLKKKKVVISYKITYVYLVQLIMFITNLNCDFHEGLENCTHHLPRRKRGTIPKGLILGQLTKEK